VRCGNKTLAKGKIDMTGLSTREKRIFQEDVVISNFNLIGKEIMWNFRGEIFDSELSQTFGPMVMRGEIFDETIKGIGYHVKIVDPRDIRVEKRVFRK
jgi:hypothetical protein